MGTFDVKALVIQLIPVIFLDSVINSCIAFHFKVNYILSLTGQSSLIYTGHSLGCAQFWIAMIKHPELAAKIDLMVGTIIFKFPIRITCFIIFYQIALAPLSSFEYFTGPLSLLLPFYQPIAVQESIY